MGDALRKKDTSVEEVAPQTAISDATDREAVSIIPVISPAKDLQDKLDRHFSVSDSKFSAQFITWLVIGACMMTWLGGIGLYTTL